MVSTDPLLINLASTTPTGPIAYSLSSTGIETINSKPASTIKIETVWPTLHPVIEEVLDLFLPTNLPLYNPNNNSSAKSSFEVTVWSPESERSKTFSFHERPVKGVVMRFGDSDQPVPVCLVQLFEFIGTRGV
ncbi:UNVERIFIED_CONTAM: hypothetical protein HDU68_009637 [Siphonaria sp. JEL0065]|nr:hypothetical protein HDU68_009637 [Siphonaria sp. JEL0065]